MVQEECSIVWIKGHFLEGKELRKEIPSQDFLPPVFSSNNSIWAPYPRVLASVAKGPKFRPQNSKGALQKFVRPEILAAEFSLNMPKKGRKRAELF
jgi:hypothetical protein